MCGIVGKYYLNQPSGINNDLTIMLRTIFHRGPDQEGRFTDRRVLLGFRRLSIIDTEQGDQPLYSEDNQIVVIANGEIYNYRELKKLLQHKGHRFRTQSDCEVIVHLYEEYGSSFLEKLNGMFAICLYDRRFEKLFLARDRIGIKPLYFYAQKGILIFASEIKAILQAKEVEVAENINVLDEYLCFRSLSGERTFFKGIKILSSGSFLVANINNIKIERYWKPSYADKQVTGQNAINLIRNRLQEAVERQLMSDVPVGTQLSGGVDSGWVSLTAARYVPGMKAFSVGFSETKFDETKQAQQIAEMGGLEFHEIKSYGNSFFSDLPKIIWHNDEPLTHANSVEIFNLCRYAKDHVKVLLTGEGADELFGGYPRYYLCKISKFYNKLHKVFRNPFCQGLDLLSARRGKKPSEFIRMMPMEQVFWNSTFTNPLKVQWLMDSKPLDFAYRRSILDELWDKQLDIIDNLLLYEIQSYLQPILLRQDKMSMGASIEARVPILDNEMIDLALQISASSKVRNFRPKILFKKAALKYLPQKIVNKRKQGFGIPVSSWIRRQENGILDILDDQKTSIPEVNSKKISKLIREHREGAVDHQDILWPLSNYVLWRKIFFSR